MLLETVNYKPGVIIVMHYCQVKHLAKLHKVKELKVDIKVSDIMKKLFNISRSLLPSV